MSKQNKKSLKKILKKSLDMAQPFDWFFNQLKCSGDYDKLSPDTLAALDSVVEARNLLYEIYTNEEQASNLHGQLKQELDVIEACQSDDPKVIEKALRKEGLSIIPSKMWNPVGRL